MEVRCPACERVIVAGLDISPGESTISPYCGRKFVYKPSSSFRDVLLGKGDFREGVIYSASLRDRRFDIIRIMRFFDGIAETRKAELLGQLRAVWTHDSTAIEGNTLTLGDTMFVLAYGLTVKGKTLKDQLDVQNHARAVDAVLEIVEQGRLTEEDLFRLHRLVINEQSNDIYKPVGAYKREDNGTYVAVDGKSVYHAYLPADDVPKAMAEWLVDFNALYNIAASADEALDAYVSAHMRLTAIHPFYDGNGRLARLVANLPVLYAGYPPIVIPMERREDYIRSIWDYERGAAELTVFRALVKESWQTTLNLVAEARK